MSFLETAIFPDTIAFGAQGGPAYATSIAESPAGVEARRGYWTAPLHRYELSLAPRTALDTRALLTFFHIVRGRAYGFRFPDFGAGESTGTDEPLGTGTGAMATYQLVKRYTSSVSTTDRVISKPRVGTVTLKSNGTPLATSAYSVNHASGIVTATATNGQALTASFRYDVPARFATDRLSIRRVDGGYVWDSIEVVEIRDIEPPALGGPLSQSLTRYYLATWEFPIDPSLVDYYTTLFAM